MIPLYHGSGTVIITVPVPLMSVIKLRFRFYYSKSYGSYGSSFGSATLAYDVTFPVHFLPPMFFFTYRFDDYFPVWLNHLMHTTVLPLQLGELYLCRHAYPR